MWPWEHAAAGYLLYSLALRAIGRRPPSDAGTVALLVGTQLPDLVDKPLSWGLGVFPSGFAVAHSAFVAVPVGVLAGVLAARADHPRVGIAFVVGYWSHLVADVLTPLRTGDPPDIGRVLWPIADVSPYGTDYGLGRGVVYFERFLSSLSTADPLVLLGYAAILLVAPVVWVLDGKPGLGLITGLLR